MLVMDKVRRVYGQAKSELVILDACEFQLSPGEMVALVAPSGAGKSTLLHLAGLLERPDAGEVFVNGMATRGMPDHRRTALRRDEIGFVYQFHHLLPEFSALENLMMPQMIRGINRRTARERSMELLEFMRIGPRAEHRPAQLSGGEQQRVAIARAVANAPNISSPTSRPAISIRKPRCMFSARSKGWFARWAWARCLQRTITSLPGAPIAA